MDYFFGGNYRQWGSYLKRCMMVCGILLLFTILDNTPPVAIATGQGEWTTYLGNNARTDFNASETLINRDTAPHLRLHWSLRVAGEISNQAIISNGKIYWGAYNGFEYAGDLYGGILWKTYLGITNAECGSTGVASTATVTSLLIEGKPTPMLFVGGGDAHFYALNAANGAIIWQTPLGSSPEHFIWSSPTVVNGSVYFGMASYGDCPLVQGQFIQLNAATGAIEHTFDVVPPACLGGTVWGSPAFDEEDGAIYFATSQDNYFAKSQTDACSKAEQYTTSLVKLRAADLSFIDSWQVPPSDQVALDGDFGSTPTLFTAAIGSVEHRMVGVMNKNGFYYAFDRNKIGAGPLWQAHVAIGGGEPITGQGSVSVAAWDGRTVYAAGGKTIIRDTKCGGSVRAIDPSSGAFRWSLCLPNAVLGAVMVVPGLVVIGAGSRIYVLDAITGDVLYTFHDTAGDATFWSPATISNGVLYQGSLDGRFLAIGL
ncbi:MAG: hypothetical protein NVSMB27_49370 [Ktedonobacteraceae bacterium]